MQALVSKMALARRVDVDPRTLDKFLEAAGIEPDFIQGPRKLFRADRVKTIRVQIRMGGR